MAGGAKRSKRARLYDSESEDISDQENFKVFFLLLLSGYVVQMAVQVNLFGLRIMLQVEGEIEDDELPDGIEDDEGGSMEDDEGESAEDEEGDSEEDDGGDSEEDDEEDNKEDEDGESEEFEDGNDKESESGDEGDEDNKDAEMEELEKEYTELRAQEQ